MKKTVMTCLAIVALLALAGTAGAITCTIDQRPAATLLVPFFQVSVDAAGLVVGTGVGARDTIVTIGNASSAPMIAHVSVYNQYSELALDFNIALTGFDVQAMRMSDVISGTLPVTVNSDGHDPCQRGDAGVYGIDGADGFLRVVPNNPASTVPNDNSQATTNYPVPAFGPGLGVVDSLSQDCAGHQDILIAPGVWSARGYVVIDHSNYCTLSNPQFSAYYNQDAIGMENNLFGEIIFTSGFGLPTYGMSTVNLEADAEFGAEALLNVDGSPVRTFYARYWNDGANFGDVNPGPASNLCPNCSGTAGNPACTAADTSHSLDCNAPWDVGYGDQREPLGLRWAARWFDLLPTITSNFQVWRGSVLAQGQTAYCDDDLVEPVSTETFWDEDENTSTTGVCPSPCSNPSFNFEFETQQKNISFFSHPSADAGWVQIDFGGGDVFDQAWVNYTFEGAIALESILVPGTQLDPSTCNPLAWPAPGTVFIFPEVPTVPTGTGKN